MHVVEIADSRYPIGEPFAGGMQALTWHLVTALRERGVRVSVFAGLGPDTAPASSRLTPTPLILSETARADVSMQPYEWVEQHHAYLQLMLQLSRRRDFDVVHNNSLHPVPVVMAEVLPTPMLTTLHTPPTPWLEPAVGLANPAAASFAAVSHYTARQWAHVVTADVVPNGVDPRRWPFGTGGTDLVWTGRIAPEKAPHLAIDIARQAGRRLRLAGPVADPAYWVSEVQPRLADDDVEYVGHLQQRDLARLVGSSSVCLVTPVWDEPYGLVAAEALCCGTPVVAFARGGLVEVVDQSSARLVPSGDVVAAAEAVKEASALDRAAARQRAVGHCSLDRAVDRYLAAFEGLRVRRAS